MAKRYPNRRRRTAFTRGDLKITKADGTVEIVSGTKAWRGAEETLLEDEAWAHNRRAAQERRAQEEDPSP